MYQIHLERAVSFIESWLEYRARHINHVGFSVAVYKEGKMIFSQAYGYADAESTSPLTTKHLYNMASQTKMFTAALIMHLAEEKMLSLDEPIATYLPCLSNHSDKRFRSIKVRHLLTHSSGILREGPQADHWGFKQRFPTKEELTKSILACDLGSFPGRKVKYSNVGYSLLGLIIESVTKRPYRSYLNDIIATHFSPNTVLHTCTDEKVVTGYGLLYRHKRPPIYHSNCDPGALAAVTGTYATPETMCRLVALLFMQKNTLLSEHSKKQMRLTHSKVKKGYDAGVEFGLGHEIRYVNSGRIVGHTGHAGGHVSATFYDPERQIVVSVATNTRDMPSDAIARGIFSALLFFLYPPDAITQNKRFPISTRRFEGRLINALSTVQIVQGPDRIVMIDPDDWEPFAWCEELKVIDDKTLRFTTKGSLYNENERVEYVFSSGEVVSIRLAGRTLLAEAIFDANLP